PTPELMDPSLYVILDRTAARGRSLEEILDATIAGGCRLGQLREKEWPTGRLLALAARLLDRCRRAGVTFIVNDRVGLAAAVGADGVQLGQDDLPPRAARALLRPGMVLGRSTHSVAQARQAGADGADYIAVGSMFPTQTKPDFELVGPELIRDVRPETKTPLVGIAGSAPPHRAHRVPAPAAPAPRASPR